MLALDHVAQSYGAKPVLEDVSFKLSPGQIGCLLGPSGCGKTTALRLVAGFERPSAGEIRIGATAHLKEVKSGEEIEYTLVDPSEADFSKGKISVQSPVAQALLGHKEGEQVTVRLPAGPVLYRVTKVSRSQH